MDAQKNYEFSELNSESEVPDVYTRWTLTLRKETHTKRQARTWKVRFFFSEKSLDVTRPNFYLTKIPKKYIILL